MIRIERKERSGCVGTRIYLDTNVYNDVERGAIPPEEVESFRRARGAGTIDTRLSLPDLEEFLGIWDSDRSTAMTRLRIARDLAGFQNLLAQPADVLAGPFVAYANGSPQPSPLMPRAYRRETAGVLGKILNRSRRFDRRMTEILADVKANKERSQAGMAKARESSLDELHTRFSKRELAGLPFSEFFAAGAAGWALGLAEPTGFANACRQRGVDGLLAVRAVRLCVGVVMSQIHAEISVGRKADFGDGYDIWHAISASTADVFVTRDDRLFSHLTRVPDVDGFRVVKSLQEALAIAGE